MGDIADDHQGYIADELEMFECDPDYYEGRYGWGNYAGALSSGPGCRLIRAPRRTAAATPDDFDVVAPALPDDCSDLV